jgi:hypothetical protein
MPFLVEGTRVHAKKKRDYACIHLTEKENNKHNKDNGIRIK